MKQTAEEAKKALEALFVSKPPAPVTRELPAEVANITEVREMADSKRGRKPIAELPVLELVQQLFEADKDKEWTVAKVIERLKLDHPGINEATIRFMVTELKKKSVIHSVRNEGHYQILKFSKPGEAKQFPAIRAKTGEGLLLSKDGGKSALNGSPADVEADMAVLREAALVIGKLERLVQRNQDILIQIEKLRSVL